MIPSEPFTDIHCHLLPGLDDGATDLDEALAMAEMAVDDGIETIVATPHQLGNNARNSGDMIRTAVAAFRRQLDRRRLPLRILPGADVRIEPDLPDKVRSGEVVSLADRRRYVLLELPHEVYLPLDRLLTELARAGMVGILSHPERNRGLIIQPKVLPPLVRQGCLLQVTAGSLTGDFGSHIQKFAESLVAQGLVHFVSTDAHGTRSRPPILGRAYQRVVKLVGENAATDLCCRNPRAVATGGTVSAGSRNSAKFARLGWFRRTFSSEPAAVETI